MVQRKVFGGGRNFSFFVTSPFRVWGKMGQKRKMEGNEGCVECRISNRDLRFKKFINLIRDTRLSGGLDDCKSLL